MTCLVVAGLLATYYIGSPILIRLLSRAAKEPQVDIFAPDDQRMPTEVALHFNRVIAELSPCGFQVFQGLALPSAVSNVKTLLLLMVNRVEKDAAVAAVMFAEAGGGRLIKAAFVACSTRFRDGTIFSTNNCHELSAFRYRSNYFLTQFPSVPDAGVVYGMHRALVKRDGPPTPKKLALEEEFNGDAAAYVKAGLLDELDYQVEIGRYYISSDGTSYRPTWKGAFIMTLGLLWPFKSLRLAARARKERRLLSELSAGT